MIFGLRRNEFPLESAQNDKSSSIGWFSSAQLCSQINRRFCFVACFGASHIRIEGIERIVNVYVVIAATH